jgi:hypothetical protein
MLAFFVSVALMGVRADAQIVETPSAFDSAGRVRSLTPALVTRFELAAPVWTVTGAFREARLFSSSTGGHVLAVERFDGAIERYALADDALQTLRTAIDQAMRARGALVTETQPDVVSEPARGAFVRNQMLLSAMLYAPMLSAQTNNGQSAAAVYLLGTGASYFIVTSIANKRTVTRTQNDLATDGALRGAMFANGMFAGLGPDEPYGKVAALLTLTGALTGSVAGFNRARGLTDAEGKAAKSMSTYSALTMTGLMGIAGVNDSVSYRATALATVAAGAVGYVLGPRYPRRSAYTITAGDINTLWIGSALGLGTAFIPLVGNNDIDERLGWVAFTAGILGGAYVAERMWVRPYDHSQGDVAQVWLGTIAGALMGSAVLVLAEPSPTIGLSLMTAGGILGAWGAQRFTRPAPARQRSARLPAQEGTSRALLEFSASGAALAAAGVRGNHGLLTIRF